MNLWFISLKCYISLLEKIIDFPVKSTDYHRIERVGVLDDGFISLSIWGRGTWHPRLVEFSRVILLGGVPETWTAGAAGSTLAINSGALTRR